MLYNWQDELIATKSGAAVEKVAANTSGAFAVDGMSDWLQLDPSAESSDGVDRPITYYQLDNLGEVTAEYAFAGDGISLSSIDAGGIPNSDYSSDLRAETTFAYDAQGGLHQTSVYSVEQCTGDVDTGDPQVTSQLFDADGNVVQTTDPMDIVTTYVYNGADEETSMAQADPITDGSDGNADSADDYTLLITSYGYDADGNETSVTDPMGNVTTYAFDTAGREVSELDPNPINGSDSGGPLTTFSYDAAGNLSSETDPDGNTTDYDYDALGRETSQTDSLDNITYYAFDGDNNVIKTTDADGQVITDTYNDLNQLTQENWYDSSDTLTNAISYTYDNLGDMLTAADDFSSYTFTYNTLGEQISSDNNGSGPDGETGTPGVPDVVMASSYDTLGSRTALDAAIGGTADFQNAYSYDGFGLESSVSQTNGDGNAVADKLATFSYNADNQYTEIDRYGGLTTSSTLIATSLYGYDTIGRLTSLDQGNSTSSTEYAGYAYTYNADNLVASSTNSAHTSENVAYTYNSDGELIAATYADDTAINETFSYDANGNPTNSGDSLVLNSNELASDGIWNYSYDANGNVTSQVGVSDGPQAGNEIDYGYDVGNRLTSVTNLTNGVVTQLIAYEYDMFGNLIARSITPYTDGVAGAATTARYVYDLSTGNMVFAFDATGAMTDRFLWGPGTNQIVADEQFTPTSAGEMPTSPGNTLWALANNQGTVEDVIDSSGDVQNHTALDPFGNAIPSLSSSAVDFLFGQAGEYTDPTTGQEFTTNRVYDPWIDRFGQTDPTGLLFGPNPYEDCGNSPTNFTDPTGLSFWGRVGGLFEAVGGIAEGVVGLAVAGVGAGTEGATLGATTVVSVPAMVAGVAMTVQGSDIAGAGLHDLWTGGDQPAQTLESQALVRAGMDRRSADYMVGGTSEIAMLGANAVLAARTPLGLRAQRCPARSGTIRFGQQGISSTFRNGEFAGQTIDDVAAGLRSGAIKPSQLPIQAITRDGVTYTMNNRSLMALRQAGMEPTVVTDVTGDPSFEAALTQRVGEMGGQVAPDFTPVVRSGGSK